MNIFSCKGVLGLKNTEYRRNRHSCYLLEYHLVVVTKYRHPVIRDDLKIRLFELSREIIETHWKCVISEMNSGTDHIHIIFEAPPQVQLSKLINNYKTVTSRILRKEFTEELSSYYWKPYFWSNSYFICTVSDRSHDIVQQYIRTQDI